MTIAAHPVTPDRPRVVPLLGAAAVLAVFSAGMWFAWLGWDHQYYLVDGVPQGPYRAWQVLGGGAAVVAATIAVRCSARHWLGLLLLPPAGAVGFAVPWSVDAASHDETGLWGVGLLLIVVGGGLGLLVVVALTDAVLHVRSR